MRFGRAGCVPAALRPVAKGDCPLRPGFAPAHQGETPKACAGSKFPDGEPVAPFAVSHLGGMIGGYALLRYWRGPGRGRRMMW